FYHILPATEPGFQVVHAALRPLHAHGTYHGVGDIHHEHGEIGTVVNWCLLDGHEIFQAPILFGITQIALQLETQTIIVNQVIIYYRAQRYMKRRHPRKSGWWRTTKDWGHTLGPRQDRWVCLDKVRYATLR